MSIGLKPENPFQQRATQSRGFSDLRELTDEDLEGLGDDKGMVTPPLKSLKTVHHMLAKLIASGKKDVEVSRITGYSQSRICILKKDPAFSELVASYADTVDEVFVDMHKRLATLGMTATEELQERLEVAPEKFTNGQLKEIVDTTMDRTVAPKKGGAPMVQVNVDTPGRNIAEEVAKMFSTAQARLAAPIELEAEEVSDDQDQGE